MIKVYSVKFHRYNSKTIPFEEETAELVFSTDDPTDEGIYDHGWRAFYQTKQYLSGAKPGWSSWMVVSGPREIESD